jgi:hypothetical protein
MSRDGFQSRPRTDELPEQERVDPVIPRPPGKRTRAPLSRFAFDSRTRPAARLQALRSPGKSNLLDANDPDHPAVSEAIGRSAGDRLPAAALAEMQRRLGADFSHVRIHTDAIADRAAQALGARAFAVGEQLFFASGAFAPDSAEGRKLLAHELTHVVQAREGRVPTDGPRVSHPSDPLEREAETRSSEVVAGPAAEMPSAAPSALAPPTSHGRIHRQVATPVLDNGMITVDTVVTIAGRRTTLPAGTYVEVLSRSATGFHVRVWSGHQGQECDIPVGNFRPETEIGNGRAGRPNDAVGYHQVTGPLWNGAGPSLDDIHQGQIGDCYVLAALGTLVRARPQAIMDLIAPHTPGLAAYQVTLYVAHLNELLGRAQLVRRTLTVDTNFPARLDGNHRATVQPSYAHGDDRAPPGAAPIWPLLLEKAYAQTRSGYQAIDNDDHSHPTHGLEDALEAFVGSRGDTNYDPSLEREARQVGVTDLGVLDSASNPLNLSEQLLPGRLREYLDQHIPVELTTTETPVAPNRQGLVDPRDPSLAELHLHHEYVLRDVDSSGRITLFNPHGAGHQLARPLTAHEIKQYFVAITISRALSP